MKSLGKEHSWSGLVKRAIIGKGSETPALIGLPEITYLHHSLDYHHNIDDSSNVNEIIIINGGGGEITQIQGMGQTGEVR